MKKRLIFLSAILVTLTLEVHSWGAVVANSATDNGDHTFTINADDEYISFTDSGGESWEIGVEWTGRTTGDILVTMDASEESITAIDIGNTAACDGTISLNIGGDADGLNGATLSLGTITDTNTNTATLNIFGSDDTDLATAVGGSSNNTISDGISATTITLDGSGLTVFNLGSITGLTTKTVATSMRVGAVGATGITASTSFTGTLTVTGSLAGPVSSSSTLGATTLEAGSTSAGDITVATGNIGAITLGDGGDDDTLTFAGDIIATAGLITSISGTDETSITISGAVTAGTSVGNIDIQIQNISGAITAWTSVGTVRVLHDLSGAITAGTTVGNVMAANDLSSNITAGTNIGDIDATAGNISGDIEATAGHFGDVLAGGAITSTASFTSGMTMGTVTAMGDIAGEITAGTTLTGIVSINGSITADSVITAGGTIVQIDVDSNETAGGAIAGTIITLAGNITIIDAGSNISGTITSAGSIGTITTDGELSGNITAGEGFTGAIQIDDGIAATGSLIATTGGFAGAADITIDTGGMAGAITSTAGDLAGLVTVEVGGLSGTVTATADDITGGVTITAGGLSGTIVATAGDICTTGITVTAGGITSTGQILAGGDISTMIVINAGGLAGTISAGTDGTGDINGPITVTDGGVASTAVISAGTNVDGMITVTDDDFAGDVTATIGNIGNVTLVSGNDGNITAEASFTAGGSIGTLTADGDFAGDVVANGGGINGIVSADGNITADSSILAAGTIMQISADTNETSSGTIDATVTTSAGNITTINAGSNITGTITAFAQIGTITTDGELSGDITAGTSFTGAIQIDDGITSTGSLFATMGGFGNSADITIDTGGMAGLIKSDVEDIDGDITITAGGLSGTIEAGMDIDGSVTVTTGGLSGTINAFNNIDGYITISNGDLTGTVQASTGSIRGGITVNTGDISATATIIAGADIDGNITVMTGDIAADIGAANNIDGNIFATNGAITGTITAYSAVGSITGNITAGSGNITSIVANGTIDGSTIRAEDDITSIIVAGDIGSGAPVTITASYADTDSTGDIGTITSNGEITAMISAINIDTIRSGGQAGEDINGTITAAGDIDLIDAGDAIVQATVTAGSATSSSPLATFISDGISFAVWAFETGSTTTIDTGVTAQIIFDGTPTETISITHLADSTPGTIPDIYITTRVATGAEQLFTDTDVDIISAPLNVTLGADSPVTIGLLYVEGNYILGSDPDINPTNITVDGGVAGAVTVPVDEDINFGQIMGDLNISVAGGGTAGYLNIRGLAGTAIAAGATVTVNGSLAGINLGDASQGSQGNVNADAAINASGAIGDITVQSDVNGSITGTSLGNITILGSYGNYFYNPIQIQATMGNIDGIFVTGSIGADNDVGDTVTIQSTAGSIGLISAAGSIGAGNGTTSILAHQNIAGVQSNQFIGDTSTVVTITASNGNIGTVSASKDDGAGIGINADITAGGDITAVTAIDPDEDDGAVKGSIISTGGNVGTVSTIAHNIYATITATTGNIDNVLINPEPGDADGIVDDGTISGNITAGGDIDVVTAQDITATIIAQAATATSPVITITDAGVVYKVNGTAGPLYSLNYQGFSHTLDITIDNWDGAQSRADSVDIALTTTESITGALHWESFDLNSLDFTAASVANSADTLGTLKVEGDLNLVETGTLAALIVEGDVSLPVLVNDSSAGYPVQAVSVGGAMEIDDPTAAQLEALFEDPDVGESVVIHTPEDGTAYNLPVGLNSLDQDISFSFGTAGGGVLTTPVLFDSQGDVSEYQVIISGGQIVDIILLPAEFILVPFDYPTIQEAIDAAESYDVIVVSPGTYTGPGNRDLDFGGKAITVRSTDPNNPALVAATVIDCQGDPCEPHRGVNFRSGETNASVLSGLTIVNGYGPEELVYGIPQSVGGAIFCTNYSSPTITNCQIRNNYADYTGGGICIRAVSGPLIRRCIITGNISNYCGGGISCDNDCFPTITQCTFSENTALDYGGALWCYRNSEMTVRNCILWSDTAAEGPEVSIHSSGYPSTVSILYSNVQGGQGGVFVRSGCTLNWNLGNIDVDPCFVDLGHWDDPCNTPSDPADDVWVTGDYHLKSQGWRWDTARQRWDYDYVTSRCIDAGNPGSFLADELLTIPDDPTNLYGENIRINMGAYGGTSNASMPPYDWTLLADLTNDGIVDTSDLAAQMQDWLVNDSDIPGDLNRNEMLDLADYVILSAEWLSETTWHE